MSSNLAETVAQELFNAYQTGQMVAQPPSARAGFDLETAYAVEGSLMRSRHAEGHRSAGRKVGYANKAMWRVLKLETLVWAHMYTDTLQFSEGSETAIRIKNPRSLKIEPEIVFGLKQPVTGGDAASALASVDWMALGFEIIDCPYPEWKFQPADFVASFGLHAALVVGQKVPVTSDRLPSLVEELAKFKVRMFKAGAMVEEGSGKNSLKSPALCLAELGSAVARRFPDEPLGAGEVISTGTLTAGHLTTASDRWTCEVEGLALPALTLTLA